MRYLTCIAALACLVAAPAALAQGRYEMAVDTEGLVAVPVNEAEPQFPSSGFRNGQEGWVRVNFVVSPDGRATDPIILDSVGGAAFERAALDTVEAWNFEAGEVEIPSNSVEMRFKLRQGSELANRNFLRRYRSIMTHVVEEEAELARRQLDRAVEIGGWNLYEEAMLNLMAGRVEGLEGDTLEKLEYYLRAEAMATRQAIDGESRRRALSRIFEMQHDFGQYGSALQTMARLKAEDGSESAVEALNPRLEELQAALASSDPLTVMGTLFTPCNCDEGRPLWYYQPARSEFSFANVGGNVESFEARCGASRLSGDVEAGSRWTLPDDPARCEIFVFGADGASFEILEHVSSETTARHQRSNVLDRTN